MGKTFQLGANDPPVPLPRLQAPIPIGGPPRAAGPAAAPATVGGAGGGQIKIETGVPMPAKRGRHCVAYPWGEMKIGDSFFVPNVKASTLSGAMCGAGKRLGVRFTARSVTGGARVWRLE